MSGFHVVIPARYASVRLPGKPLCDIGGRPMVVRVMEQASLAGACSVWVATDHEAVQAAVVAAGGQAMLTRPDHTSGTERLAEVAARLGWEDDTIVVNVQGDEPLIAPSLIRLMAQALQEDPLAAIATAAHRIHDPADCFNPNVVKVVCDAQHRALYFSRAPIPWARGMFDHHCASLPAAMPVLRHIGIYAYRAAFLHRYGKLSVSPLEHWESLEQLRALWHGDRIVVRSLAEAPLPGIDTEEDLQRVRRMFDQEVQNA